MMTLGRGPSLWTKLPIILRAILAGFLIAAAAANVWLLLHLNFGVQRAAVIEAIFLALFLWWAYGEGPPGATQAARAKAFRRGIAHSGDHRSFCDGRRAVRLLVDWYRWRLHRASDQRNRCGSVLRHRMLCVCDRACFRAARDLEAP